MLTWPLGADGAELLLDLGWSPSIIGGFLLPVLGAVPDSAIIVASGIGPDAQEQLSVGMGTLAGSTIMLLTIPWLGGMFLGKCDLGPDGQSIDETNKLGFDLYRTGVSLSPDVRESVKVMLFTTLPYFIIQGADWYFGPTDENPQPAYVLKCALATFVLCMVGLIVYSGLQIWQGIAGEREKKKAEERRRRAHFSAISAALYLRALMEKTRSNKNLAATAAAAESSPATSAAGAASSSESTPLLAEGGAPTEKKALKAGMMWKRATKTQELTESATDINGDQGAAAGSGAAKAPAASAAPFGIAAAASQPVAAEHDAHGEEEEPRWKIGLKSLTMLTIGVGMVSVFSDPMCDVLSALVDTDNSSYIPIPAFYISFIVTPVCSNASELISSLMFAAKKKKENSSMTFAQLYGAATMNNTLCLGIFMILVYLQGLEWTYSAEVLVIILVQFIVGAIAWRDTYKLWMALPVVLLYPLSIALVAILESSAVGWQ
jgi:Ca2+/Na+ antiporter